MYVLIANNYVKTCLCIVYDSVNSETYYMSYHNWCTSTLQHFAIEMF